jgi:hypothetical protein
VGLPSAPPLRPDEIRGTPTVSIPTQPNPLTVAAGLAGGVVLAVSVFLPLADNTSSFARIVQNTLIQHGGWPVLILGLCAAAAGLRATTGKNMRGTLLILGLLAGGYVAYMASNKGLRTLYPIVNGNPDTSQPGVVAGVGIGIYVAAVGAGIVLLGRRVLAREDHGEQHRHATIARGTRGRRPRRRGPSRVRADEEVPGLCRDGPARCPRVQTLRVPVRAASRVTGSALAAGGVCGDV